MPTHGHALLSSTNVGTTSTPDNTVQLATTNVSTESVYAPQTGITAYATMAADSVSFTGSGLSHDNMMPTLVGNFCICTAGIFPTQS